MNLVVGSCFRQSSDAHIARYARQIRTLKEAAARVGDVLHVVSVWGDSTDRTKERLTNVLGMLHLHSLQVIERSHGFPNYGSSTHPDRLAGFAYAANGVFETIGAGADVVIYVESDLIWTPQTLYRLIDQLKPGVDVVAPMTFVNGTETHYDFWGLRTLDGESVGPHAPYSRHLKRDRLTELSSVGSCVVMRGEVARRCRCTATDAIVGLCVQARQFGYHVFVDARERVHHP